MSNQTGSSYNQLMKHMRHSGIQISGEAQKRQLVLSGYYHGYKGYRYCKEPKNRIPFNHFTQIQAILEFDEGIKACLYSPVMQFETALKSIVSDIVVKEAGSNAFSEIIEKLMHSSLHSDQSNFIKRKYEMRDEVYSYLTRSYKRGNIVKHYYDRDVYVPIWALFEVITLGQFG
ncbi:MAG: Abi family protein, partial [Eubacteriales bacterium]|nr:Abi family protein [Eubacteriales bacterium]